MIRLTRSIDNFLSKKEQKTILDFISEYTNRKYTALNEKVRGSTILDTTDLFSLYEIKKDKWGTRLGQRVVDTEYTWLSFIKENKINCAIDHFLITFESILEDNSLIYGNKDILTKLETGLSECKVSDENKNPCPCPADS